MALELGPFSNNATAARIDIGNVTVPADVTYFVWTYRAGEGGGNFGRVFGRSAGYHDLFSNNTNVLNTYGFGDIGNIQYYYWIRPAAFTWASISISGTTSDTSTAPTIYQNGAKPALTKVGTTGWWGTLSSVSMHIGNRPSDSGRVWHGMLAHFCMWDVKLTDAEHEALHAGALPNTIRPGSIVRYFPLLNNERNLFGSDGTNVSCLFSNLNPPVFDLNDTPVDLFYVSAGGAVSLIINDIAQSHSLATADLTQQSTLSVNSLLQEQFANNISLTQANVLSIAGLNQSQPLGSVTLSQSTLLALQALAHDQALQSTNLTQASSITIQSLAQSHGVDAIALGTGVNLAINSLNQLHQLENVNLINNYSLTVNNLIHGHVLNHLELNSQGVDLIVDDINASHVLDSVSLTQQAALDLFSLTHIQTLSVAYFGVISTPANRIYSVKKHDRNYAVLANDRIIVIN